MAGKTKSGGGAKKYGRNKVKCGAYKERRRRRKNKIREAMKRYGRCAPKTLKRVLAGIREDK